MATLPKQLIEQIKENRNIEEAIREEQARRSGNPVLRSVDSGSQIEETTSAPAPVESPENGGEQDSAGVNGVTPPVAEQPTDVSAVDTSTQQAGDAPTEAPAPSDDPDSETWKHKYQVLNGKYLAEVPRFARDLAEANRRIAELTARIEELDSQAAAPEPDPASNQNVSPSVATTGFVTPAQVQEFGEDMVEFARNAARDVVGEQFSALSGKLITQVNRLAADVDTLKARTSNIAQVQEVTTESSLHAYLDANVKNWRAQNEDPHFLGWLSQPDPLSGIPRRELLNQAYTKRDAPRVATIFDRFQQENAASTVAAPTTEPPPRQQRTPPVDLDAMVTPAPASSGEHPAPAESAAKPPGRVITGAEIKQFYADSQRGHYDQYPDLYAEREAEIKLAIKEGRVTP